VHEKHNMLVYKGPNRCWSGDNVWTRGSVSYTLILYSGAEQISEIQRDIVREGDHCEAIHTRGTNGGHQVWMFFCKVHRDRIRWCGKGPTLAGELVGHHCVCTRYYIPGESGGTYIERGLFQG
jgi:hypothetical protein